MANISYQFISADDYVSELEKKSKIYDKYRFLLACALKDGVLVENDQKNNQEVANLLINNEYSWAKLKLAEMLCEGDLLGSGPELKEVYPLLKKATECKDNCPPAWLKLGWMRALGLGGKQRNLEEAKKCCEEYGKKRCEFFRAVVIYRSYWKKSGDEYSFIWEES